METGPISLFPIMVFGLITHTTHIRSTMTMRSFFFLWFVSNHTFCSQQHTCNRSSIFQSNTGNFCRINYTGFQQVFILSVRALKPKSPFPSFTFCTTIEPSIPAFSTMMRSGSSIARLTIAIPVVSSSLWPLTLAQGFQ